MKIVRITRRHGKLSVERVQVARKARMNRKRMEVPAKQVVANQLRLKWMNLVSINLPIKYTICMRY